MRYYTNRELARLFDINLAKWKRWSREFLPPDPLGGLQSGYARQYHHDDAFTVYLGGHLVADLRFSIAQAKQILSDLHLWLAAAGYYENSVIESPASEAIDRMVKRYHIHIQQQRGPAGHSIGFLYTVRGIISQKTVSVRGFPVQQMQFFEKILVSPDVRSDSNALDIAKRLNISDVYSRFLKRLKEKHPAPSVSR